MQQRANVTGSAVVWSEGCSAGFTSWQRFCKPVPGRIGNSQRVVVSAVTAQRVLVGYGCCRQVVVGQLLVPCQAGCKEAA